MMENSQKDNIIKPTKSKKEPKAPEWLFANIAEASKNARKIYFLYIGFLFYCAFTVFGTPDRYIILKEKIKMPILNVDVPLTGFMLMAPLVAIFLFVYLQMYLGRLKWLIDLSTNYAPIERGRLYPWMLNFPKDPEGGLTKVLQKIIIKFSLWGLLPLVLGLFNYASLRTHNSLICYFVGITPIIGATSVLIFWCRYERVQRKFLKFIKKNLGKVLLTLLMFLFEITLLFSWIPMAKRGELFTLDLSYEKLITEPKPDYPGIYWGHFAGAHLEGAMLISTILERADLRWAQLQYANMSKAHLVRADLTNANLRGANLREAKLREATLTKADLERADLVRADLTEADLSIAALIGAIFDGAILKGAGLYGADLREAKLMRADLTNAKLMTADLIGADLIYAKLNGADLSGADLTNAKLTDANLTNAKLMGAILDKADLFRANLTDANLIEADLADANLSGANLSGANLTNAKLMTADLIGADLIYAKLTDANLTNAKLNGAKLMRADLTNANLMGAKLNGARNLTIEQLSKVKTLYQAKLDPELEKEIKEKYPLLLEKPKEEEE